MHITIKLSTELSHSIDVDNVTTNSHLYSKIAQDLHDLPPTFKLINNGEKLVNDDSELVLQDGMQFILMSDEKKKKKVRCSFVGCNGLPLRMVGDCHSCNGKFCAKHRLFEDHRCEGLGSYKDMVKERNGVKLLSEATKV